MSNARQHAQTIGKRAFWTEFFALYESLPSLWDLNDPSYKDRQSKAHGYEMLVMKMREIDPHACREDVLRKINIFRTNYRRECARIKTSYRMGKRYTTSLWYFHMLNFLQTQEFRKDRKRLPNEEKKILRRVGSKMMPSQSDNETSRLQVSDSSQALPDNSSEYKSQISKYECISDNGTESEEHLEAVQYADENSFQQQFQNQFHTLSFASQNQQNIKSTIEGESDAENFHEIINTDDSSQPHDDALEELELVEHSLCNKDVLSTCRESTPPQFSEQPITITTRKITKTPSKVKSDAKLRHERQSRSSRPISEASEILAKSWAIQYEEMSHEQRIYARKAISEILFEGCLGNLGRRRIVQQKANASEAVVSSQYEQAQIMEESAVTENVTEETLLHMDDDSHTYVYGGGSGPVQIQEYI
ncbi:uncharacterized protein LOC118746696 [Rhagoletis pomonella]|uniref:uncharacterized protein LOC118746696 n=1 Tax=Rhagoletis pomonella TaxID=28610 RepID=UPI001784F8D3|nr:uncharacterized protein LOC118746696 [Rhagoletis pomonella]